MTNEKILRLLNKIEKAYYSDIKEPCGEYLLTGIDDNDDTTPKKRR